MTFKLSILDQSPIPEGSSASKSLMQTTELAKNAEKWGYHRFWVSEHHDAPTLAGSAPEILIAHLAANTKSIRVGSGGVMLPHYSAFKVAEQFKVLEALYPNRIDLGVGRAPGGMPRATLALHDGKYRDVHRFPEQIDELHMYLNDTLPEGHPYYGMKATPVTPSAPPVWMLGSSENSARLAADKGLPYMFAQFINGEGGPMYAHLYQSRFQPSPYLQKPEQGVAVFVACAETDEEANRMISSWDLSLIRLEQGIPSTGVPSPETAMNYPYTEYEKRRIAANRERAIVGTPEKVKQQIEQLAEQFQADEVMLVTIAFDYEQKLRSFELIAKEFNLNQ